jgi:hypothetical protein
MKTYYIQQNIGHAKYVVCYHDGYGQCEDGSPFHNIAIFKNKKKLQAFTKQLESEGYVYDNK